MPLHPAVVHLPLGLAFVMPWIVLWLGIALMQGRIARAGWGLVVSLQAILVVGALVAASTGETDAELVERLGGGLHDRIEAHEEQAQLFIAFAVLGAIAALATLRRIGERGMRLGIGATMLFALLALSQGLRAGHAGGEIVYTTRAVEAHRPTIQPPGRDPSRGAGHGHEEREHHD